MSKRGQMSMEYLMIVGFSLALISILFVIYNYQNTNQNLQVVDSQISKIGNSIITTAEEIYYLGEPSRKGLTIYMPAGITNITINANELLFKYSQSGKLTELEYPSDIQITGNLSSSSGVKHLHIIAQNNRVCIIEQGDSECTY